MSRSAVMVLVLVACGNAPLPIVPVAPKPRSLPLQPAVDEQAWHFFKPQPFVGDPGATTDPRALYPWVRSPIAASECRVHAVKGAGFLTCGASLGRFEQTRIDFESFRDLPFGTELPRWVSGSWPNDLWIRADAWNVVESDPFIRYSGSYVHYENGKVNRYPTIHPPTVYRSGYLLLDIPRKETIDTKAPGCADYSCGNLARDSGRRTSTRLISRRSDRRSPGLISEELTLVMRSTDQGPSTS